MDKHAIWKWLLLLVVVTGSLALVFPIHERVRFGLDLQGGTSFTVEVDEQAIRRQLAEELKGTDEEEAARRIAEALSSARERALEVIRNRVDGLGIDEPNIYAAGRNRIVVQLPGVGEEKRRTAARSIQSAAFLEFRMVHADDGELVDKLFEAGKAPAGYVVATRQQGTATLQGYKRDKKAVPDAEMDEDFREKLARFEAPPGYDFMLEREEIGNETLYRPHFVSRRRELTGDTLKSARVDYRGSVLQPVVRLQFDARGARKFARVTTDYAPGGAKNPNPRNFRLMAIVMDGTLYSAPSIREPIHGGKAEISGSFSQKEAAYLANVLRAGSLPAPVKIVEQRTVDPSLGVDSIRSGIRAGIVGGLAMILFMGGYYLVSGAVANLALCLNIILLPLAMVIVAGSLSVIGGQDARTGLALPVLTVPGIAGIILMIGMAVDANVLIFERIREELSTGKRLLVAIAAGYSRAFTAILDANITTLIAAVVLFRFGSGPVRGFAVTLAAGILCSMYTAVVVSRMFLTTIAEKAKLQTLKMLSLVRSPNLDFIAKWKVAGVFSAVVIVATCALMVGRGVRDPASILSVDFTGGSSLTFGFQEKQPVEAVREALSAVGIADAYIQYQAPFEQGGVETLQIKAGPEQGDLVANTLAASFVGAEFRVLQQDDIGPQVGRELKTRAFWAMVIALGLMIVYISFRFEFGFSLGAIAALVHDVLFTAGVFCLFGRQLSLTSVAALLTIIGYSVNDTIVIFDRIREDIRLTRNRSFKELANLGINQCLSRTLLTATTTLIAVVILLIFGGGAINDFALTMCIGVLAGTYSTMFIATPVVLLWYRNRTPDFGPKTVK